MFALDSEFDNTYLTGYNAATGKVSRTRWQQDLRTRNISNNVEAEGLFHTGAIEHRVLFGMEFANQDRSPRLYTAATRGLGAQPVPTLDLYDPDLSRQHQGAMTINSDARHKVRTQGYYAQDQIKLNEAWQVLLGLRLDRFNIDSTNRLLDASASRSSGVSPRAGVVWTPLRDHSFYASYSKTFSPTGGGLIGITPNARGNTNELDPERTRQYEVGVKSDWLDGRLSTTLAFYNLELYNRRTTDPNDPGIVLLTGLQRSRGVELTAAGRLQGNWYLRGGLGLQNASIVEDNNGLAGNRVGNVARRNGSVFLTYAGRGPVRRNRRHLCRPALCRQRQHGGAARLCALGRAGRLSHGSVGLAPGGAQPDRQDLLRVGHQRGPDPHRRTAHRGGDRAVPVLSGALFQAGQVPACNRQGQG